MKTYKVELYFDPFLSDEEVIAKCLLLGFYQHLSIKIERPPGYSKTIASQEIPLDLPSPRTRNKEEIKDSIEREGYKYLSLLMMASVLEKMEKEKHYATRTEMKEEPICLDPPKEDLDFFFRNCSPDPVS